MPKPPQHALTHARTAIAIAIAIAIAAQDDNVWDKSRAQIYDELATLAASSGADRAAVAAKLARVEVEGEHNTGNATTNTLKLYTKWTRGRGLHVTPTVLINGIVDDSVSSGWSLQQWTEYLDKLLE